MSTRKCSTLEMRILQILLLANFVVKLGLPIYGGQLQPRELHTALHAVHCAVRSERQLRVVNYR